MVPNPALVGIDHKKPCRECLLSNIGMCMRRLSRKLASSILWSNHSQRGRSQRQLRADLGPVTQTTDEGARGKFVRHNDLIARVKVNPLELRSGKKAIYVLGRHHKAVRP